MYWSDKVVIYWYWSDKVVIYWYWSVKVVIYWYWSVKVVIYWYWSVKVVIYWYWSVKVVIYWYWSVKVVIYWYDKMVLYLYWSVFVFMKKLLYDTFSNLSHAKYGLVNMDSTSSTQKSTNPKLMIFLALTYINMTGWLCIVCVFILILHTGMSQIWGDYKAHVIDYDYDYLNISWLRLRLHDFLM